MPSYDVVVVGAGHNGLVAAAYLARAGLRVCVCERREIVGGAAVTEELAPGFRVSTASYSLSLLRPDIVADLGLASRGLEVMPKDPQMFVPLQDGRHFFVWRDAERTRDELDRIHPGDGDGYLRWSAFWDEAVARLRPLVEDPDPPSLDEVRKLLPDEVWRLAVAGSAARTASAFFAAPEVQGAFASQGIIGTWAPVTAPGTAWVAAYHELGGEVCGRTGTWAYVRGGMGAVSRAICGAATEAGAEVRLGAVVSEIVCDAGGVRGVRLEDGALVEARVVVSGADPKTTAGLVSAGALPVDFRERVEAWPTPGCVLKVNLALRELPDFTALPGSGPQQEGTVEIAPSIDYLVEAYEDAARGEPSRRPFMEVFVQSAVDRSLVDGDGHVVSVFAQYVPPGGGPSWEQVRERGAEAVIETLASYAPNVRGAIVAKDVLGPPELEARLGLSGGNIFHGEILPEHSFGERFDYRLPVEGLYLCGSGARPGGGVMGAAGRNAARFVIGDLAKGG